MFQHFPVETPNVHQLLGSGQPYADMFGGTRIVYVRRIQYLIESLPKYFIYIVGPTEGGVQGLGILCLCIWCMVLANPTNM